MLRYLDKSDDVRVGITVLQERLEVPAQIVSIQQVAQQARSESGRKMFEVFRQQEEELCSCQLGQMGGAVKRLSRIGKKMSRQQVGKYKC